MREIVSLWEIHEVRTLPVWSSEEATAMGWLMITEGTAGLHKIIASGVEVPIIRMQSLDCGLVDYASARFGTKPDVVTRPSRRGGFNLTVYTARATGTRATVFFLRMWPKMPEGARKRRFRDFMLKEAIPRTSRAISLPYVAPRLPSLLGMTAEEIGRGLDAWLVAESYKPTEPWRQKEREAWLLSRQRS